MSSNLKVSDLDFDSIKSNLIEFLKSKPGFTDYDYEGSGLAVLIDLLAYNAHYEAVIANQVMNELTIDTARNRNIVALHAKRLGYTPRSAKASRTRVNLEVLNPVGNPATLTLGRGAQFSATVDNETFGFTTLEPKTIARTNNRYIFSDLEIAQGTFKTFRYVVDSNSKAFAIPDDMVDTDNLRVYVQVSRTNTARVEYFKAERISTVKSDSNAYFLQMNAQGFYEVTFGDGVFGVKPSVNNVIVLEYLVTSGAAANGISKVSFIDFVEGNGNTILTQSAQTSGGADPEDIDSIRFNAYRSTMTQDRAVTELDYADIISSIFPVDAISVWGGETNDPPVYGKVFVAIKPVDAETVLTETDKNYITQTIKNTKSVVTVKPEFVDVDYLYIEPTTVVYIDDTKINTTDGYIKTLAIDKIKEYSKDHLEKFKRIFRFSKFVSSIDTIDPSVISNITSIKMSKRFVPNTGVVDSWKIAFNNPISAGSFYSTAFRMQGSDVDLYMMDSNGIIMATYIEDNVRKIFNSNIGTVNYTTGLVDINSTLFESFSGSFISMSCIPASPDVVSVRNMIALIDKEKINVSVVTESFNTSEHEFSTTR